MPTPNYSILFSAQLVSATSVTAGQVLVTSSGDGTKYVVATTANRGSRRAEGIALTSWNSTSPGSVQMQQAGTIDATISGLAAGSASWVRCSATGTIERFTPVFGGTSDILGWAEADGRVHLIIGTLTETIVVGGGASPGGSDGDVQIKNGPDLAGRTLTGTGGITITDTGTELEVDGSDIVGFTAGGDLSGTSTSQTVQKVRGTQVSTAGGSLASGKVLQVTGAATADWTSLPAGVDGDIQIKNGNLFDPIHGTADGDIVRFDGADWIVEPGVSIPSGSAGDFVALDGTGGLEKIALVAGTNITLTPGTGTLTIAASGGGGGSSSSGSSGDINVADGAGGWLDQGGSLAGGTSDHVDFGAAPPANGYIRATAPGSSTTPIVVLKQGGTEYDCLQIDTSAGQLILGNTNAHNLVLKGYAVNVTVGSGNSFDVSVAGSYGMSLTNAVAAFAQPLAGHVAASEPSKMDHATISMASSGNTDAAPAEYACFFLTLSGVSAGPASLTLPDKPKATHNIKNPTAVNITVKKSGGSGCTINAGTTEWVHHNGTDYELR